MKASIATLIALALVTVSAGVAGASATADAQEDATCAIDAVCKVICIVDRLAGTHLCTITAPDATALEVQATG